MKIKVSYADTTLEAALPPNPTIAQEEACHREIESEDSLPLDEETVWEALNDDEALAEVISRLEDEYEVTIDSYGEEFNLPDGSPDDTIPKKILEAIVEYVKEYTK